MRRMFVLAGLLSVYASPALSERITFPIDHSYPTVRGLAVDDDKKGVIVVTGNEFVKSGRHIVSVNDQAVKTAREFSLLVAAISASKGELSITSESEPVVQKSDRPAIPAKEWARALAFSDSSNGVIVEYSLIPEQIGGIFTKFNDEPVASAADLKAKLDRFIASPVGDWSTTISHSGAAPSIEQIKADAITKALPPIKYSQATANARPLFLYRAVENEPPRPSAEETNAYAEAWGPLAKLAGKFFIGDIFDESCEKASSGNPCYSMFWWQQPGKVLTRAWFADRGFLVAADTILPTGKPGLYMVHRWRPGPGEVGNHFVRVTKTTLSEKGVKFQFVDHPANSAMPSDEPRMVGLTQIEPFRPRSMSSYSRSLALENSKDLRDSIQRSINATREAERQRQRDASMSAAYGALNSLGQAMEQQRLEQQVQYEQQMRDLQRSQATSNNSQSGSSSRAIIMESLANPMDGSPPLKSVNSPVPPATYDPNSRGPDDCKRREMRKTFNVSTGQYEMMPICLDASAVSPQ